MRYLTAKRRAAQSGTSLLETLIAATLLSIVAIAIFPMFHRALANNISGSDANIATQHGRSELEELLALPYDSQVFDMMDERRLPEHAIVTEATGEKMVVGDLYWDPEANVEDPGFSGDKTRRIATGAWISDPDDAEGLVVWRRRSAVRQYAYSDIGEGVIDVNNPSQVVTQGDPQLFDVPLTRDAPDSQINFREEEVTLTSMRPGVPQFQTRLIRTY